MGNQQPNLIKGGSTTIPQGSRTQAYGVRKREHPHSG